jgi:glycerophosphoryl diester phosphodiesterase
MPILQGFAVLPADSFDEDFFDIDSPPAGEAVDANGRTGPFPAQPIQGFSGVQFADGDGSYWFLSDNGFGSQGNSADYLLRLYQVDPNFSGAENGDSTIAVEDFIQLADPNRLIPFDIVNGDTTVRRLTGADFDIESFVIDGSGDIWIGDEFGPYILHFDQNGTLLKAPIPTPNLIELDTLNGQVPLVIGHRGASGDFPEHTLAAYEAAIAQGADFIEPDLVTTSDGVLIARHEPILDDTTNVAEVFGEDRKSTKMLDGEEVTAYFAEDFTLAEIKQLRAVQSRPGDRDTGFDGLFEIPTLAEVIELVQQVEADTGVSVGIYPETKHPTFFDKQGLSLEEPLVQTLVDTDFTDPNRIFIQSFEVANLIDLQNNILPAAGLENIPLVQLYGDVEDAFLNANGGGFSAPYDVVANFSNPEFTTEDAAATYGNLVNIVPDFGADVTGDGIPDTTYADLATQAVFNAIGDAYAEGVGPWKNSFILREPLDTPVDGNGDGVAEITTQLTGEVRPYVEWAHNAGMQIHPYTLRDEERFLTLEPDGSPQTPEEEVEQLINLGVDGFFTDFPRTVDPVRDAVTTDEVRAPQNPDFDFPTLTDEPPIIIAHRGASGDFPEHTLEAYRLAIAQGADFVEPDLVTTSDGVLIARHEPMLDDTTNVAEVFPERQTTKMLDGEEVTAYFAEDFTLAEIKQLRAVQQLGFRDSSYDGQFEIPTFAEVIELVQEMEQFGFEVGIYPETKHPTFFDQQGLSLEEPLIQTLQDTGFTNPDRIFIQSFEFQNLIELQGLLNDAGLGDIPLVQLYGNTTEGANPDSGFSFPYDIRYNIEQGNDLAAIYGQDFLDAVEQPLSENTVYADLDSAEFLQVISDLYAEGAGPWKNNFLLRESLETPVDGDGDGEAEITTQLTGEVTSFVDDAHAAGLQVHPYTLRNEERFLTLEADGTPQTPGEEFRQLIDIGVDGFFTDFPATGVITLEPLIEEPNLPTSRGYEGMAFSPDRMTLYPMLEGSVEGDPDNSLRIYEFDVAAGEFTDIVGFYPKSVNNHAIGDFTPINETEFLVIERDGGEAENAEFKKIFKIDLSQIDADGFVAKEEVVDLLNIEDPNDLNNDGETTYRMPFVTIEDVLVIDENTILVANDNNYPFSMGRPPKIDNNEVVLIELDEPLNLDSRLGQDAEPDSEPRLIFDSPEFNGEFDSEVSDNFDGNRELVFAGAGDDGIFTSEGIGNNRIYAGSGMDEVIVGKRDRAFGGDDNDNLTALGDNNRLYGGKGADELTIVSGADNRLFGDGDNDTLDATPGDGGNRLYGNAGSDMLFAGMGDTLVGGEGDDMLFNNGTGGNTFTGGTEADQFWIVNSNLDIITEVTTITDFELGTDVIGLGGAGVNDFSVLTLTEANGDSQIALNGQDLAIVSGVTGLGAGNFAFA